MCVFVFVFVFTICLLFVFYQRYLLSEPGAEEAVDDEVGGGVDDEEDVGDELWNVNIFARSKSFKLNSTQRKILPKEYLWHFATLDVADEAE